MLANVIWAANWPYWYRWFPLSAAIGFIAELLTFHFYERHHLRFPRSILLVTVANLASWFAGGLLLGFIGFFLDPGDSYFLVPQPLGRPWDRFSAIGWQFLAAYVLTVAIEYSVYRRACRGVSVYRLQAATLMSNCVSYAVTAAGFVLLWLPGFRSPDEWLLLYLKKIA